MWVLCVISTMTEDLKAVIFDLGGVVYDSPFSGIAEYERSLGLERNALNHAILKGGADGAWSRLEKGLVSMEEFYRLMDKEFEDHDLPTASGKEFMRYVSRYIRVRSNMVDAIQRLRESGRFKVVALTNNWKVAPEDTNAAGNLPDVSPLFDDVIESAKEGVRKPHRKIYEITLNRIGCGPEECIFLDDIGLNLKAARAMGINTIRVKNSPKGVIDALFELQEMTDVQVIGPFISSEIETSSIIEKCVTVISLINGEVSEGQLWTDAVRNQFTDNVFFRDAHNPRGIVGIEVVSRQFENIQNKNCGWRIVEISPSGLTAMLLLKARNDQHAVSHSVIAVLAICPSPALRVYRLEIFDPHDRASL